MGDPAGVGPEIALKTLVRADAHQNCRPFLVGNPQIFARCAEDLKIDPELQTVTDVSEAVLKPGRITILNPCNNDTLPIAPGKVSAAAGQAAFEAIRTAIELAKARQVDAIVTNPIHKEALNLAGYGFPGHTEILAHFTGARSVGMLMAHGHFRVVHVSGHVSLREACNLVNKNRIVESITLLYRACIQLGIALPCIGVAGLNPHASDNGLFGQEEEREILPAVKEAGAKGWQVEGPIPPDTLFAKAASGLYDGVVAMYHDQGLIPFKMHTFKHGKDGRFAEVCGVNITLGLPIVRTSVAHGTAFDIAGKGIASPASLIEALDYAVRLAGSDANAGTAAPAS